MALCQEFGISRPTGYERSTRYREAGVAGSPNAVGDRRSPRRTATAVEASGGGVARAYPDWGARKLRVLLRRDRTELARSTIHRILLRRGLMREPEQPRRRRNGSSAACRTSSGRWTSKAQLWDEGVGPLSVIDDHSRYVIAPQGVTNTRAELVREHLEAAFRECGMPEGMLMDHGTPWWSCTVPGE